MRASKETIEFLKKAISEQHESGFTLEEYCRLIEKQVQRFYYWKRKLSEQSTILDTHNSDGFVKVFHPKKNH